MSFQIKPLHVLAVLVFVLWAGSSQSTPADVAGVIGLRSVESNNCVAVWIPIPENRALSDFSWYNNSGDTVFPEMLLESGHPDNPVILQDCQSMAVDVMGQSSGWSEVEFSTPVACLSEGLYLLIRFPEGDEYSSDGLGGGAGIGYMTDGNGLTGWMSANGEDWIAFQEDFGFAVQPHLTAAAEGMLVMQSVQNGSEVSRLETVLQPPSPNPFNPQTSLQFTLAKDTQVELAVYDIRGQLIKMLLNEAMTAGAHEVQWFGRDARGQHQASGVYFVRLKTDSFSMSRRMVLVQ